ncbi:FAD-binding oxidoreductase [Lacisediminihabitans sp.]|uniref:FAD-binding oxidoreductase n=1 Tax=Lacisediminihabitans sp. TaxID=2787631 RepID=UPI00374DE45A
MTSPVTTPPTLSVPGDAGYAAATASYNLRSTIAPIAAAVATTSSQVQDLVTLARERAVKVRVQSTGHGFNSVRPMGDALLIRTEMDSPVFVNPAEKTAVIPAGATWGDVVAASAPFGLAPLHGSSATVGAIGYLLQGGISFYGRRHGVASNSVRSITLVLANSSLVTVDAESGSDLFWALRGGGGGFGVVTSVTVGLVDVPSVVTGSTFWPASAMATVLEAWDAWCRTASDRASTAFRVMRIPPQPGLPAELTDGPVVCIDGAVLEAGDLSATDVINGLLDPIRARVTPLLDTWHRGGALDVSTTHADPPVPVPFFGDHVSLTELGAGAVNALTEAVAEPSAASLAVVELRQLGGALAVADPTGGAVNSVSGEYGFFAVGIIAGPNAEEQVAAELDRLRSVLAPWTSDYTVPSFVERLGAPQKSFDDATAARVNDLRRRFDPDGLFGGDVA